jgi:dipeptidyl-peptidase-3
MDHADLKHFLADSPPTTVNLVIKQHFDALKDKEKLYAHYISK